MGLTQLQRAIVAKARSVGGGKLGMALTDESCAYLVAAVAKDLNFLGQFPEFPDNLPSFFQRDSFDRQEITDVDFETVFERMVGLDSNADNYFSCLATLQKARLKYERILETQPIPTIDQVGPRGLLQFGSVRASALTAFLLWRKWIFDIDNRAGQETGYVFEPIIAAAIGGVSVSSSKSPVRRQADLTKGRQIDCLRTEKRRKWAYEIKIRLTIAASGQGRWREELEFPGDCRQSGYTPVLVVLDPTSNAKLHELTRAFLQQRGEVYVGANAWNHLEALAGPTMARFLETYVHDPIQQLLAGIPSKRDELPELVLRMQDGQFSATLCGDSLSIARKPDTPEAIESVEIADSE